MASLMENFFSDGGAFEKVANTWLSYENIRQQNDANGTNQAAMLNTPTTTAQVQNDPATQAAASGTIAGMSTPMLIGLGVAGAVGLVLLIKK
ncbi:hypothetical protein [Vibrio viridaestus]|uniref:Uncharacterized protein n=1 Tax=Vibrio viridaestus TaxID=2487322 RepID=A0A3N9TAH2_9VIBR|nr:hypothetical protein [Vibrio viridaestus]RQW61029.1 hypothetical protein EES38_21510 [Vibrio viridaestus]